MIRGCIVIILFLGAMLASAEETSQAFEVGHEDCQLVLNQKTDEVDSTVDETWKAMIACVKQLTDLGTDLSKVMTQSKVSNAHYLGSYTKLYAELLHLQGAQMSNELQEGHTAARDNFLNVVAHNDYELQKLEPYSEYNREGWDVEGDCKGKAADGACTPEETAAHEALKKYKAKDAEIKGSYDQDLSDGPVKMKEFDQEKDDARYAAGLHDFQLHCNQMAEKESGETSGTKAIAAAHAAAAGDAVNLANVNNSAQLLAATGCLTMFNGICSHLVGGKAVACENLKNAMFKLQNSNDAERKLALTIAADPLKKSCPPPKASSLLQTLQPATAAAAGETCENWVAETFTSCIDKLQTPLQELAADDASAEVSASNHAARVGVQRAAEEAMHTACPQQMRKLDPMWFWGVLDGGEGFPIPDADIVDFKKECDKLSIGDEAAKQADAKACQTAMSGACGATATSDPSGARCIDFNQWILKLGKEKHNWRLEETDFTNACGPPTDESTAGVEKKKLCTDALKSYHDDCFKPLVEASAAAPTGAEGSTPTSLVEASAAQGSTPAEGTPTAGSEAEDSAEVKKCAETSDAVMANLLR